MAAVSAMSVMAPTNTSSNNGGSGANMSADNLTGGSLDSLPAAANTGHDSGASSLENSPVHSLSTLNAPLSPAEEGAAHEFLSIVNEWRSTRGYDPLSWASAVKFLMARKFNVDRALQLYQQHELMRIREGLTVFDPTQSPLAEELRTQKFTILPRKDANGATLALFNASKHEPGQTHHRTTLQGVVYQLDVALEETSTQRGGLVFIYNMCGSKYSNFDYDLSQKMLTLLKGAYPARLKKVLIVTAPLWFKAPFKVLRLFVREKLRDRVFTVSLPQLQTHVSADAVPKEMGGTMETDHAAWLEHCAAVTLNKDGELVTMSSSQPSTPHDKRKQHPTLEQLESMPLTTKAEGVSSSANLVTSATASNGLTKLIIPPPAPPPEDEDKMKTVNGANAVATTVGAGNGVESNNDMVRSNCSSGGLSGDDADVLPVSDGITLPEFIEHVRVKARKGLYDEYSEIKNRPPTGTFNYARAYENQAKNRYTDVLCYDHSRVTLADGEDGGDYVNANFVDGYEQPRAFISSQGPLPKTFPDFWQMVWEQRVLVIVMTTKTVERHRTKCGQYWPEAAGTSLTAGRYEIHSEDVEQCGEDFVVTRLTVKSLVTGELREVAHFQFVSWPDYGVPDSALSMLHFLQRIRERQAEMTADISAEELPEEERWHGHPLGPPIVVHCSAGIGRTGTFATLDIAIRKFEDLGKVDIRSTVERIRGQRAFSIQMPDQYVFCHLAFLEYVLNMEYIEEIDLTGFDEDCESD